MCPDLNQPANLRSVWLTCTLARIGLDQLTVDRVQTDRLVPIDIN